MNMLGEFLLSRLLSIRLDRPLNKSFLFKPERKEIFTRVVKTLFSQVTHANAQWHSLSRGPCEYFARKTHDRAFDRRVIGDDPHFHMARRGVCRNCAATSSIGEAYSRRYPLINRERGRWWPLNSPSVCLRVATWRMETSPYLPQLLSY